MTRSGFQRGHRPTMGTVSPGVAESTSGPGAARRDAHRHLQGSLTMTRRSGHPKWLSGENAVDLEPVAINDALISEAWLQHLLDVHPELIPLSDIGPGWGPLISLGREISVDTGSIDNLFVSPDGDVTVVETKLWRNPQARREVVGQILDYAAALSGLTFEAFDRAVASGDPDSSIWQRVQNSPYALDDHEQASFIDAVARNLRTGRFLLLVAGDGIRENLDDLASQLQQHPGLRFHLELIELRLFRPTNSAGSDLLIVPSVVARTHEIQRALVTVSTREGTSVQVEVTPVEETPGRSLPTITSIDDYEQRVAETLGPDAASAAASLARWWQDELGGKIRYRGTSSINLAAPYSPLADGYVSVMTMYTHKLEGSVKSLCEWQDVVPYQDALEQYRAAGFSGNGEWPRRDVDGLSRPDEEVAMKDLLRWVRDAVAEAEARLQQRP